MYPNFVWNSDERSAAFDSCESLLYQQLSLYSRVPGSIYLPGPGRFTPPPRDAWMYPFHQVYRMGRPPTFMATVERRQRSFTVRVPGEPRLVLATGHDAAFVRVDAEIGAVPEFLICALRGFGARVLL